MVTRPSQDKGAEGFVWAKRRQRASNGQWLLSLCTVGSLYLRPMRRFASKMVFFGLVAACGGASKKWFRREFLESSGIVWKPRRAAHATAPHDNHVRLRHGGADPTRGRVCARRERRCCGHEERTRTWFTAASPSRRSVSVKATTDGVVLETRVRKRNVSLTMLFWVGALPNRPATSSQRAHTYCQCHLLRR